VIDADGNAVSATLSVNLPFGAAFSVPGTGVVLNNEMDDFAADPSGSNSYRPGRQPGQRRGGGQAATVEHEPDLHRKPKPVRQLRHARRQPDPEHGAAVGAGVPGRPPVAEWPATPRYHHQYLPDVVEHEPGTFSDAQKPSCRRAGIG
jgi:gamma-glutamyltranspeptidase/glutathione hydrolase